MFDLNNTDEVIPLATRRDAQLAQFGKFLQYLFKRFLVFVCFGPGVLGFLWLVGRLFKR